MPSFIIFNMSSFIIVSSWSQKPYSSARKWSTHMRPLILHSRSRFPRNQMLHPLNLHCSSTFRNTYFANLFHRIGGSTLPCHMNAPHVLHLLQQRQHDVPVNPCTLQDFCHLAPASLQFFPCHFRRLFRRRCVTVSCRCSLFTPLSAPTARLSHSIGSSSSCRSGTTAAAYHVANTDLCAITLFPLIHGFPLRVRFLEECQAQHFPRFRCGALSLKSLVKPTRNLVGKCHGQGSENLRNNHIPKGTGLFLQHLPRRAKHG